MIKRLIASLGLIICLCFTAMANKELSIKLDGKDSVKRENLGFAYVTFEYLYANGNNARVRVSIENITGDPPHAVILFRSNLTEQTLKKGKPKIEFDKTYPGKKGEEREVMGCRDCKSYMDIITAAKTDTIFIVDVPFTSSKDFLLPLYEAKYKAKDLFKQTKKHPADGEYYISYKIIEKHIFDVHIEVVGWSEDDPTYVNTKKEVETFLSSLNGKKFCKNKKHSPSLTEQQRPYQEKKDSLIQNIKNILDNHSEWMSNNAPHIAYTRLWTELEKVNLNNMTHDCGEHKVIPKGHSCSFCSLSSQEIYQRLDDLYQQLYAGNLTKEQALKTAKSLYNCYQQNKKRKKDSSYGTKISRFYNSIANY